MGNLPTTTTGKYRLFYGKKSSFFNNKIQYFTVKNKRFLKDILFPLNIFIWQSFRDAVAPHFNDTLKKINFASITKYTFKRKFSQKSFFF